MPCRFGWFYELQPSIENLLIASDHWSIGPLFELWLAKNMPLRSCIWYSFSLTLQTFYLVSIYSEPELLPSWLHPLQGLQILVLMVYVQSLPKSLTPGWKVNSSSHQVGYIEELTRFSQCLNAKTSFANFWSVYQPFLFWIFMFQIVHFSDFRRAVSKWKQLDSSSIYPSW